MVSQVTYVFVCCGCAFVRVLSVCLLSVCVTVSMCVVVCIESGRTVLGEELGRGHVHADLHLHSHNTTHNTKTRRQVSYPRPFHTTPHWSKAFLACALACLPGIAPSALSIYPDIHKHISILCFWVGALPCRCSRPSRWPTPAAPHPPCCSVFFKHSKTKGTKVSVETHTGF